MHINEFAKFQPKQIEAFNTMLDPRCKYLLYGGAAAGGKSYFLRWAAIALAIYYFKKYGIRNIPIGLFSEDYPTLKDRQIARIKKEVDPRLGELKETRDEGYIFRLSEDLGGGLIMLRNLDDPSKYASTEFAAELVEELTKNPKDTFDDLRFRLRYPGIPDPKFVGATNPGQIGHGWVKSLWVKPNPLNADREQDQFFFIPADYKDNKYIDKGYINQLEALPERKRRAYMDGSWDIFEGQYFSEWNERIHVIHSFMPHKDYIIVGGMDWGRTAPFAFVLTMLTRMSHEGKKFFRAKTFLEVYGTEKTPKEWADEIKVRINDFGLKMTDIDWIRGDPAMFTKGQDNSISIADQFKENNIRILPASNDRIGGWENLHQWLTLAPDGLPFWQIASNCINLIRTLPELVHDKNRVEDVDTDGNDHAPDAARYQFKHLKRPGEFIGGVLQDQNTAPPKMFMAKMDQGKQIAIDLNKFVR